MPSSDFSPSAGQLRAFVTVADTLSFRAAADQLGLRQPSLSQALATLEAGLGARLLDRTPRSVALTPTGRRVLPAARSALEALQAVRDDAAAGERPLSGVFRLGLIPTLAPNLLPTLVECAARRLPGLRLELVEAQTTALVRDLRAGRLDAAVLALPTGEVGLDEVAAFDEPFVLVTGPDHRLAGRTDLVMGELSGQTVLLPGDGHCLRDQTIQLCRAAEISVLGGAAVRADTVPTLVRAVAAGYGVALIPSTAVTSETRGLGLGTARFAPTGSGHGAAGPPEHPVGRRMGVVTRTASAAAAEAGTLADLVTEAARAAGEVNPCPVGQPTPARE